MMSGRTVMGWMIPCVIGLCVGCGAEGTGAEAVATGGHAASVGAPAGGSGGSGGSVAAGGSAGVGAEGGAAGEGGGAAGSGLTQQSQISDCGGFPTTTDFDPQGGEPGYCDAEVLAWTYEEAASRLTLSDNRVALNCCGVHDMSAELVRNVLVITETDAPESMGMRCNCMCVFDFAMVVDGVTGSELSVRLMRHVTDEASAPQAVWEGVLDLTAGAGSEILDDSPAMCGE